MPRLAIRLHFVVSLAGWFAKPLTFAEHLLTNLAHRLVSNAKAPPPNGAWCRGCWQNRLHFCSTLPAQPASMKRRHDALFLVKNQASLRHTIAGAFAAQFAAISGRNGVPLPNVIPYAATHTHPTTAESSFDTIPDAWLPRA